MNLLQEKGARPLEELRKLNKEKEKEKMSI